MKGVAKITAHKRCIVLSQLQQAIISYLLDATKCIMKWAIVCRIMLDSAYLIQSESGRVDFLPAEVEEVSIPNLASQVSSGVIRWTKPVATPADNFQLLRNYLN